ncbi:MAG: PKD-like family lipoprotein, partial [Odoribacter sp.]
MKTEIIYWSLILLLGLGACAEDTGNYDYKCINGITIKQLPTDYNDPKIIYVGDVVQFIPEFIFEKEQDTIGLSYLWIMDKDTVANTRNLNKVILLSPRNRVFGSYRVYDSKTDVEYITPFYLSIKASLENGWIFLCKKANGCGQLNFFRAEDKENDIKEWLLIDGYLDANGEDLGKEPISIRHHFLPMHSMYMFDNQISVICQGGPDLSIEVDGNTFKKVICNK